MYEKRVNIDELASTVSKVDKSNPLYQQYCAFTGSLSTMSRAEAMQCVKNLGGFPQNGVNANTSILIVGNPDHVTNKMKKAMDKGIRIIGEEELLEAVKRIDQGDAVVENPFATLRSTCQQIEKLKKSSQLLLKDIIKEQFFTSKEHLKKVSVIWEHTEEFNELKYEGFLEEIDDPISVIATMKGPTIAKCLRELGYTGYAKRSREYLIPWTRENVSPEDWELLIKDVNASVVVIAQGARQHIRKAYSYLIRKFDWDWVLDHETRQEICVPYGMELQISDDNGERKYSASWPKGEIEDLLIENGYTRETDCFESRAFIWDYE